MDTDAREAAIDAPSKTKVQRLQLFIVEEFHGLLIAVGAFVFGLTRLVPWLEDLTVPAVAAMLVGVAFRIFRVRYELAAVEENLGHGISEVDDRLVALHDAVLSKNLHQAERCDRPQFYKHMLRALEGATRTVDLTQLDERAPKHYGTPEMEAYFQRQAQVVKERPSVIFRRIVAVPTLDKLDWLLDVLERASGYSNFQLNVIDIAEAVKLPLPLSLQIFDRRELCLVDPTLGYMRPEEQRNMLWVDGREVAEVFAVYYQSLWQLSDRVKEGSVIYWPVLRTLLTELRIQDPNESELADSIEARLDVLSGTAQAVAP